jgi:CheY-like chemotaxis protein
MRWFRPTPPLDTQTLLIALQRIADGLPLPLETGSLPPPLGTALPTLARRLQEVSSRLAALAETARELPAPLPEESGVAGLAHAVNVLLAREAQRRREVADLSDWLDAALAGDYGSRLNETGVLDAALMAKFNQLAAQLQTLDAAQKATERRAQATAKLNDALRGEHDLPELGRRLLAQVCAHTGALSGAFYLRQDDGRYLRIATHALSQRHSLSHAFRPGEGLLGQAVVQGELVVVRDIPADYLPLESGLAQGQPRQVLLWPIALLGQPLAAVELAGLDAFTSEHLDWLREISEAVAVVLSMAQARAAMAVLLAESQAKNEELRTQQEELRAQGEAMQRLNAALEEKNEAAMRLQAELEEKNELLTRQQAELEEHNALLEQQKAELRERQAEVERASRYKSEFLANMSHELRTPLNSLLLLAGHLLDNEEGNLTPDQLESLAMIKKGGQDLLALINDILDLSKIEAGQLKVIREPVEPVTQMRELIHQLAPLARAKGIGLHMHHEPGTPGLIYSDGQRIAQILKNLIGNAIKFTDQGEVSVRLAPIDAPLDLPGGGRLNDGVRFDVIDTGPGIAPERHAEVFEAFQQGDGSITRKYGGTGLGLTISRQLARRLGGDILLESTPGQGSRFTLVLPLDGLGREDSAVQVSPQPADTDAPVPVSSPTPISLALPEANPLDDDRDACVPGERTLLVIEDDTAFAATLLKQIRKKGFKALAATNGRDGLALAAHFRPAGIVLDLGLPDMDGREVLERLKADVHLRDIPVHVVSARDRDPALLALGVVDFLQKPLTPDALHDLLDALAGASGQMPNRLLVVEDDDLTCKALEKALASQPVSLHFVHTGAAALEALEQGGFDGMLLDLGLPDMSGRALLETMAERGLQLPVIVHTGKELDETEYLALRAHTDNIVLKGGEGSRRLLDEVALFLHGLQTRVARPAVRHPPAEGDAVLAGRKVLLVDDDVRNAFALNKVLRKQGLNVVIANDGQLALDKLAEHPDIELVMMDIMMPVMDGYEAIRRIRADDRFKHLPVIALTAKAMAEDRDKCLAAGADDYLAKPIDLDKLLSLLRLYLHRGKK